MACGVLLDSSDLPRSKWTQPIYTGTKHNLVVTYTELNESKKRNDIFILKFPYSLYLATQIYTALDSGLVKNKTLSDNLHYAACKQSHSVLQSIGAGVYERARCCSEWVNERISDSSECSNVSELVFERAHSSAHEATPLLTCNFHCSIFKCFMCASDFC